MPENRIEQLTPATAATDQRLAPASPTGTPWLPQWAVRLLTVAAGLGAVEVSVSAIFPLPTWANAVGVGLVGLAAAFGIASPGLRTPSSPSSPG